MLPLKAASFPHFASRWGCLKRAGRVLKVLINRGTSNMFGKDLHFHTGTLNYCNPSSPPPPSSSSQTADRRLPHHFSHLWHFEEFVVAVYWPPLYDNGGEKTLHLQKKRQEPILISVWTNANVKWKEEREDAGEGKAIRWHLFSWWWWMVKEGRRTSNTRPLGGYPSTAADVKVWLYFRDVEESCWGRCAWWWQMLTSGVMFLQGRQLSSVMWPNGWAACSEAVG